MAGDGYEELDHTADWSLRIWGGTMAELLESAARGMLALMGAETSASEGAPRIIDLRADDRESLLVAWLDELLFQFETEQVVPIAVALEAGDDWMRGTLFQAPCTAPQKPIKAVTFHNLKVVETSAGLQAELVFDV